MNVELSRFGAAGRAAALVVCAAALFAFLFLPDLARGRIFAFRDVANYHLPVSRLVSEELRAGRFPFWNPGIACGTPLAANPNNYAWYPGRLLDVVASPELAISGHLLGHWALGGIALGLLATMLGASVPAAVGATAAFLLAGPSLSLLNFANLAPFLLWIPLTLIAGVALLRAPGPGPAAALAVCLAVQTTFAEPAFAVMEVLLLASVPALDRSRRGAPDRRGRRIAGWGIVAAGVALLLAAPMWVPMLRLVESSARAADLKADVEYVVRGWSLVQYVVPQFLGEYHTLEKSTYWGEIFQNGKGPFFLSLSLGIAVPAIAVAGLLAEGRRGVPLLVAAGFGLLFAMGPALPGFVALAKSDAGHWFRFPVKLTVLPAVALSLGTAFGIDALGPRGGSARRTFAAIVVAILAGAAVVFCFGMASRFAEPGTGDGIGSLLDRVRHAKDVPAILDEVRIRFVRAGVVSLALAVVALASPFQARRARFVGVVPIALVALIVLELVGPQRQVNRGTPLEVLRVGTPILAEARELATPDHRIHFPTNHWEARLPRRAGLPDEWWPRVRLDRELGNFYHPVGEGIRMVLVNPDRLVSAGALRRAQVWGRLNKADQRRMLELLGVNGTVRLAAAALRTERPAHPTIAGWPVSLEEDSEAAPIVSWLDELPAEGDRPWSGPWVRSAGAHVIEHADLRAVHVRRSHAGRWILDVTADRDGWVTLTESRDAGWRARLDGDPVPIQSYLSEFQAVAVPRGRHRLEWSYRPPGFAGLVAASALGWIGIGGLLILRRRTGS